MYHCLALYKNTMWNRFFKMCELRCCDILFAKIMTKVALYGMQVKIKNCIYI